MRATDSQRRHSDAPSAAHRFSESTCETVRIHGGDGEKRRHLGLELSRSIRIPRAGRTHGSVLLTPRPRFTYPRPRLTRTDLLGGRHQLAHRQTDPEETDEELHRPDRWDAHRNPRRRQRPHERRSLPLQAEGRKRQSSRKRAPRPSDRRRADLLHRQAERIPQRDQPLLPQPLRNKHPLRNQEPAFPRTRNREDPVEEGIGAPTGHQNDLHGDPRLTAPTAPAFRNSAPDTAQPRLTAQRQCNGPAARNRGGAIESDSVNQLSHRRELTSSSCRPSRGAGRPRRRARPCPPQRTCPTNAGRTSSCCRPRRRS